MAWYYNGKKYWYHNGKRYSRRIRRKKRIGYFWRTPFGWQQTSYSGYMDARASGRSVRMRELYRDENEFL